MKSKLLLSVLLVGGLHNVWGTEKKNTKNELMKSGGIAITAGLGTTAAMYATNKFIANNKPDIVGTSIIAGAGLLAGLGWYHRNSLKQTIPSQNTAIKGLVTVAGAGLGFYLMNSFNILTHLAIVQSNNTLPSNFEVSKIISLISATALGACGAYGMISKFYK